MAYGHKFANLALLSHLRLPELAPWDQTGAADVIIENGDVPTELPSCFYRSPFLQMSPDGDCLVTVAGIARFWVRGGRSILVDPRPDASADEVRLFLLGTVFGVLCHQRHMLPLHAAALVIGGRAICLAGPSQVGKSTLAAALAKRGHVFLSDDVSVITQDQGGPRVWPSVGRLKLWADSLAALEMDPEAHLLARRDSGKYLIRHALDDCAEGVPLADILVIQEMGAGFPMGVLLQTGVDAVMHLTTHVYRLHAAHVMGRTPLLFRAVSQLAASVRMGLFQRQRRFDRLDEQVRFLERWVEGGERG